MPSRARPFRLRSRWLPLLGALFLVPALARPEDTPPAEQPAPAAPAEEPAPSPPAPVEVTSFVDVYYGYNLNKPAGDAPLRNFDTRHNAFSINLAEVALEKKVATESRVGFRMDLDFGPASEMVAAFEPSDAGQDVFKHFQQGYLSVLAGSKLQLDVGKFVTPHGAEVIESKDNWNYSRSLLFALAIPYYHVGLRATLPVNDKLTLAGYAVNGWNNSTENNSGKTFGLQATVKPSGKLTWIAAVMAGPEQADNTDDNRFLFDTTLSLAVGPKLSLMANYDYGSDKIAGADVSWSGVALYAKLQATESWALVPRFEFLDDDDGFMTGTSQKVKEFTVTSEHKIAGALLARIEYRVDFSDQPFFTKSDGSSRKSQSTLGVGFIYVIGGKI